MVKTEVGIIYLLRTVNGIAYCYDDQTGKNYQFPENEVTKVL